MRFLRLMLDDFSQRTQCLVHGFGIWEDLRHIGIKDYYVAAFHKATHILSTYSAAEIILIQHVRITLIIQFLIHICSFQLAWPVAHYSRSHFLLASRCKRDRYLTVIKLINTFCKCLATIWTGEPAEAVLAED